MVSRPDLEGLLSARDEVPERLSAIPPGLPESIRAAAMGIAADSSDVVSTIDAITAYVRELGRDESVVPGHSFARLRDDLSSRRPTGAEQIASLHALMLRAVGIPSRLVVGYAVNDSTVVSADLHVWTEAAFPGVGWVPFDPVPADIGGGLELDDDTTATTTLPSDSALEARALPRELGPGEDPTEPRIESRNNFTRRHAVMLMVITVMLVLASVVGTRVVRRQFRRNTSGRADIRVLGAWAEVIDRLRELGAPISNITTVDDVVYMATAVDPSLGEEVRQVADLAAIAFHSPDGPVAVEADQAWDQLRAVERQITVLKGRRMIAFRYLDPRVLRHGVPNPPRSRHGRGRADATTQSPR